MAILGGVFAVLKYARVGRLHGSTFKLYVTAGEVRDVIVGTDVWLGGQRVGSVTGITFQPIDVPLARRVVIHTEVLSSVRDRIRYGSRVDLKPGGTPIGPPVVYISAGDARTAAVTDGDTLAIRPRTELEDAMKRVTPAIADAPVIIGDLRETMANVRTVRARSAALMSGAGVGRRALRSVGELRKRLDSPNSSAGLLLLHRDVLMAKVSHTMATADSIHTLVSTRAQSLGRLRSDSSLFLAVANARAELDTLRRAAMADSGSIGRVMVDSALVMSLDSVRAQMSALFADMKRHPLRYIHLY